MGTSRGLRLFCVALWRTVFRDLIPSGVDPGYGKGILRPKVADVAKQSHASEVINLWPGSRALQWALEAFGFLMPKYAFSHIPEALFRWFKLKPPYSIAHDNL